MYLLVRQTMAANHGLITTAQARDCGLTTSHIAHLLRTGALVIVRRGVYADGEAWRALDEDRGRHRVRTRAATLRMSRGFVASHDSSAHEHGLEILNPVVPHVHITRPGSTNAWTEHGVKHHLARFRSDQVQHIDGLEVLDLARTAVDIAREHGEPYGEIACDAAMRMGVPRSALEDACAIMVHWPHHRRTERAVAFARAEAANLAETMTRMLVAELGIGEPDPQFPVRLDNGRVAWGDVRVNRHIFEFFGEIKLRPPEAGGVAKAPGFEVLREAKRRDIDLGHEGLGVSHVMWPDLWGDQRKAAKRRLRTEYDETVRRFGEELPERLVRQARELRGQRGA
jgi:hypothetical protein